MLDDERGYERKHAKPLPREICGQANRELAASAIAEARARQIEEILRREAHHPAFAAFKAEFAAFLELMKAGGVPLGLPAFPQHQLNENSLSYASLRRAYDEFCQAIRERQVARSRSGS